MSVTLNGTSGLVFSDGTIQGTAGAMAFRNRIINGDMRIDQRNNGASVNSSTFAPYCVDRWQTSVATSSLFTTQQVTDAPPGFTNSLKITVTTAKASVAVGDEIMLRQSIEGNNFADFDYGKSTAKDTTISFWAKSSLTGTFSGALRNATATRAYAFTYTINAANTWEYKTISIPGDTTGTWETGTSIGVRLQFDLGCGDNLRLAAGSWSNYSGGVGATGAVRLINTLNATLQITGVQFEKASAATSFENRPIGVELALCQRYYQKTSGGGNTRHAISGNGGLAQAFPTMWLKVPMRTTPSVSYSALSDFVLEALSGGQGTATLITYNAGTTDNITLNVTTGTSGGTGANLLGSGSGAWIAYAAEY